MARYKDYNYGQSKLLPINFAEQILPGRFEYTVNYLVDNELDLTFFDSRCNNDETGCPAYDPAILLKIILALIKSLRSLFLHILKNLLNQMQFFKIEALKSNDFDQEVLKLYDVAIDEASGLIERLSQIENITEENIWASVDPNNIENLSNNANSGGTKNLGPD